MWMNGTELEKEQEPHPPPTLTVWKVKVHAPCGWSLRSGCTEERGDTDNVSHFSSTEDNMVLTLVQVVSNVQRQTCRWSPWVLSASDRRGTALCPPLTSPASSACRGRCPWTASPGSCGEEEEEEEGEEEEEESGHSAGQPMSHSAFRNGRELTNRANGPERFQQWKRPGARWPVGETIPKSTIFF